MINNGPFQFPINLLGSNYMKIPSRFLCLSGLVILLASCSNNAGKANNAATAEKTDTTKTATAAAAKTSSVITDSTIGKDSHNKLNDIALYLAGMKPDSSVAIPQKLQKLAYYKLYSDSMDRGFKHIEEIRLSKMR